MKDSFIFYASFLEAIEELDDKKQFKLYKAIANFALKNQEPEKLGAIEKAIFALIKPQITANNKRYEDGKKGGRPKKNKTTGFENNKTTGYIEEKPNVNVNVNDNVNENVNVNENDEVLFLDEKKEDPYIKNSVIKKFQDEYLQVFNCKAFLTAQQCLKVMELNADIPDFKETIPIAIKRLKNVEFDLPNFTPTANWLLKGDNYTAILNGEWEKKKKIDKSEPKRTCLQDVNPILEEYAAAEQVAEAERGTFDLKEYKQKLIAKRGSQ